MDQQEMLQRLGALISELDELQVHIRQLEPVVAVYLAQASTIVAGAREELAALGAAADVEVLVDLTRSYQASG